jgi:3-deoxy-7-phosphoheptulonate synthase
LFIVLKGFKDMDKNLKLVKEKKKGFSVSVKDKVIGKDFIFIAGPCSISSYEKLLLLAKDLKTIEVDILRGGAFKPRTSPYDFQGLGFEGIKNLFKVGKELDLAIVSEVMDTKDIEKVHDYLDIFQVGSRNMHNYALLKELGKTKKPILLKQGYAATITEWLLAAEYILKEGNPNVILCQRGTRNFENSLRNSLDIGTTTYIKNFTNLPLIVDPSHAVGKAKLIKNVSKACVAAMCDGLMIEVEEDPKKAISDSLQTLDLKQYEKLVKEVKKLKEFLGS